MIYVVVNLLPLFKITNQWHMLLMLHHFQKLCKVFMSFVSVQNTFRYLFGNGGNILRWWSLILLTCFSNHIQQWYICYSVLCYLVNLYPTRENLLGKFREPLRQRLDIRMGNTACRGQVKPFASNKAVWVNIDNSEEMFLRPSCKTMAPQSLG